MIVSEDTKRIASLSACPWFFRDGMRSPYCDHQMKGHCSPTHCVISMFIATDADGYNIIIIIIIIFFFSKGCQNATYTQIITVVCVVCTTVCISIVTAVVVVERRVLLNYFFMLFRFVDVTLLCWL